MNALPAPLVPVEVDLRGFEWMPYFGRHVFDSEFNAKANDAEFRAAHSLWWAAWNQVPAGSLPDDEAALARFADLGRDVKAWRKVRDMALHAFLKCDDGRLYHRFLCKEVLKSWAQRQSGEVNRETHRIRMQAWRDAKRDKHIADNKDSTNAACDMSRDISRNGLGDAHVTSLTLQDITEHKKESPHTPRKRGIVPEEDFKQFWEGWPHKIGIGAARIALARALKKASLVDILAGVHRYVANKPPDRPWCNPSTFLNQERWTDQPVEIQVTNGYGKKLDERFREYTPLSVPDAPSGPPPTLSRRGGENVQQ